MKKEWSQPKLEILDVALTEYGSGGTYRDRYVWDEDANAIIEEFFRS